MPPQSAPRCGLPYCAIARRSQLDGHRGTEKIRAKLHQLRICAPFEGERESKSSTRRRPCRLSQSLTRGCTRTRRCAQGWSWKGITAAWAARQTTPCRCASGSRLLRWRGEVMRHAHRELSKRKPWMRRRQLIAQLPQAGKVRPHRLRVSQIWRYRHQAAHFQTAKIGQLLQQLLQLRRSRLQARLRFFVAQLDLDQHRQPPPHFGCGLVQPLRQRSESSVSTEENSSAARAALFDCRCPIRWNSAHVAEPSGAFSANSCTRFSPKSRMPSALAAIIADAGCIFETAISATSARGRPARGRPPRSAPRSARNSPARTRRRSCSMAMFFQVLLHLERRHAARAGRGNRLPVSPVLYVAAGKYPGNAGEDLVVVRIYPSSSRSISP